MKKVKKLRNLLYITVFINGAIILVIELLGTRILSPFYGSTMFVWSSLIVVTLGALALGYFIGGRIADKFPEIRKLFLVIMCGGASTLFLTKVNEPILAFSDSFGFTWGPLVSSFILFFFPLTLLGMVTPYAIRLREPEKEHSGNVSGTIYAIATIGSMTGAIITGFYLIPNFGIQKIIVFSSLLLIAISVVGVLIFGKLNDKIIVALAISLGALIFPFQSQNLKVAVLYDDNSYYGDVKVVARDGIRCLLVGGQGQTCIDSETGEQIFSYPVMISDYLEKTGRFDEEKGKLLIIGFGGGVMAKDMVDKFNHIDGVEIDQKIVDAAEKYFGYDKSDERISVFVTDGRNYIQETDSKYDVIVLDAFSGVSPVAHLHTKEAFSEIKSKLSEKGLLFINTIGYPTGEKAKLQRSLYKTLKEVFPDVIAMSTEGTGEASDIVGNVVFVASRSEIDFPFNEEFLVTYDDAVLEDEIILTDDRNPIELLGLPIFEESRRSYREFLTGTL